MYSSSFDTVFHIIAFYEEIYGRSCIPKSNKNHFHPQFPIIIFTIKSFSFSDV